MELASVNTPVAALVAGLVTSLHCAGMCGPLACLLAPAKGSNDDPVTMQATYHGTRLAAYLTLGLVAGGLGAAPLRWLDNPGARVLPWLMVAYFAFVALRLGSRLPRLALLARVQLRLRTWRQGRSGWQVAAVMGAATPLLPCGPLYFLVALASLAGSAAQGAELMLAFGLGTVPLLWAVQLNHGWLRSRLTPVGMTRLQQGIAVIALGVLLWRLRADFGLLGPSVNNFICH
jgi:sulfite exporter TauE/SafE